MTELALASQAQVLAWLRVPEQRSSLLGLQVLLVMAPPVKVILALFEVSLDGRQICWMVLQTLQVSMLAVMLTSTRGRSRLCRRSRRYLPGIIGAETGATGAGGGAAMLALWLICKVQPDVPFWSQNLRVKRPLVLLNRYLCILATPLTQSWSSLCAQDLEVEVELPMVMSCEALLMLQGKEQLLHPPLSCRRVGVMVILQGVEGNGMLKRDWTVHLPARLLVEIGEDCSGGWTGFGGWGCEVFFAAGADIGAKSGFLGSQAEVQANSAVRATEESQSLRLPLKLRTYLLLSNAAVKFLDGQVDTTGVRTMLFLSLTVQLRTRLPWQRVI